MRKILQQKRTQKIFAFVLPSNGLVLFVITLFFFHYQVYPQKLNVSIENYGIEQGMFSQFVSNVYQGHKGFLWFTTENGLDRYDGYNFLSFKYSFNPKGVIERVSNTIAEDNDGCIWIASFNGGLEKFDPDSHTFTNYILDPSKPATDYANSVYAIYIDRNDIMWVGTGYGLYKFDKENKTFTSFRHNKKDPFSLGHNSINGIYEDRTGMFWLATGGGLDKLDRRTNRFYHYWHYPNNKWRDKKTGIYWLQQIIEDNEGILWIGSDGGLLKFEKNSDKFTLFHRDKTNYEGLRKSVILSLGQKNSDQIWLGTSSGLDLFNKRKETFIDFKREDKILNSLDDKTFLSVLFDKEGSLWAVSGTGGGIYKVNFVNPSFKEFTYNSTRRKDFSLKKVIGISEDKDKNIRVLTNEGLDIISPRMNKVSGRYPIKNIEDGYLLSGEIWIYPGSGGLYKYNLQQNKWTCYLDSAATTLTQNFKSIAIGKNGLLWLGNAVGELFSLNPETKKLKIIKKIRGDIYTVYQDAYGLVWFGGFSTGLFCYNPGTKTISEYNSVQNDSTTIPDDSFFSFYESKNGVLWIGSYTGIAKFNRAENNFSRFTGNGDFLKHRIRAMVEDNNGYLWISTEKGITKFNPATGQFKDYYTTRYFPGIKFLRLVSFKASNGTLYFGGENGFVRFHPDSLTNDDDFIPPIAITSFKKFEKPSPFGKEIELSHSENSISFEFSALSYINSSENQYAYKMEGVDKDWIYCGTRRFASYSNMQPGEYIFRVKGSSSSRVWNEAGTSLRIIILPPWWKTWWAYTIYGCFLFGLLYGLRRYELNRQNLKHSWELERIEAEKYQEIDRIKSRFFANISHEFRTPLTLILGPSENILNEAPSENTINQAGQIKRNANRLLRLINQLLDLSKLEAGRLKLRASKNNIVPFIKGITMSFESVAEEKDITLKVKAEKDEIELYFDKEKMMKVITNLLSNAFKFTNDRGQITITINESDHDLVSIKVRDTGMGISEKELPKLFDRFYQVDSSQTREHEGTGIGLALTKELVELHHGRISAESKSGQWTEFTIELPAGREHLKEEEIVGAEEPVKEVIIVDKEEFSRTEVSVEQEPDKDKNIVLVVEDNTDVREFIKDSLGEEFQIEEASNGEQGVRKAEQFIPDLIISDIMMPKMDGNELTRILKNDERTSHIPIILLTAKSGQENKIEGLQTGADDYLTKPFDLQELRVRVNNLISTRIKLQEKYSKGEFLLKLTGKKLESLDEKFLARVLVVIENHLSEEDFSIATLVKEVNMSHSQVHRKLKALTGKSPSLYVRTVRLAKAKEMILKRTGNISEIAYSVGFSSPAYFTRCFKEEFGVPPSEIIQ